MELTTITDAEASLPRPAGTFPSILATVGRTPVVRLNNIGPAHVEIYAKLEAFNPMGSVKDRPALGIIEAAERDGAHKPGQTVVEATSGNTGIGLAMVCAAKGYPLVVTMAENFSVERRKRMRFFGARVILTPASEKWSGMVAKAEELAQVHAKNAADDYPQLRLVFDFSNIDVLEVVRELGLEAEVCSRQTKRRKSGDSVRLAGSV